MPGQPENPPFAPPASPEPSASAMVAIRLLQTPELSLPRWSFPWVVQKPVRPARWGPSCWPVLILRPEMSSK